MAVPASGLNRHIKIAEKKSVIAPQMMRPGFAIGRRQWLDMVEKSKYIRMIAEYIGRADDRSIERRAPANSSGQSYNR
jgi:hypothetical protein